MHRSELVGLRCRDDADCDQILRMDEAVGEADAARAQDRVAQRHRPVVLEQINAAAESLGSLEMSHASSSENA